MEEVHVDGLPALGCDAQGDCVWAQAAQAELSRPCAERRRCGVPVSWAPGGHSTDTCAQKLALVAPLSLTDPALTAVSVANQVQSSQLRWMSSGLSGSPPVAERSHV